MRKTTVSMFRSFERMQEQMARAVMPRADVASPEPVRSRYEGEMVAVRRGVRLVRPAMGPLTATVAEVARG